MTLDRQRAGHTRSRKHAHPNASHKNTAANTMTRHSIDARYINRNGYKIVPAIINITTHRGGAGPWKDRLAHYHYAHMEDGRHVTTDSMHHINRLPVQNPKVIKRTTKPINKAHTIDSKHIATTRQCTRSGRSTSELPARGVREGPRRTGGVTGWWWGRRAEHAAVGRRAE